MRAIQSLLPRPRHTEVMRIFVQASPEVAWEAARHHDMSAIPWVRFLFNLRTVADLFHDHGPGPEDRRIGIDQIEAHGKGFMIVHEEPGKEVVVGAVGQFWHLDIPFKELKREAFKDFQEPGWGKLAWSITVEPYLSGSTICLELRTTATDEESWKNLKRYYHLIGIFSHAIRRSLLGRLEKQLGKLPLLPDKETPLAGDDIIPEAKYAETDSIIIEAPRFIVWRYLMQLGCDRAGWYSIDWLDHGGVPSTDHLVNEWGDRKVGDRLAATPKQDSFFEVYRVQHEQCFVIGGEAQRMGGPFQVSWAFVLEPIGTDATRLVTRAKMICSPKLTEWFLGNLVYPPMHGLMEAVQLKTIKRYAERDARMRIFPRSLKGSAGEQPRVANILWSEADHDKSEGK